jgi:hypothetical protein
MYFYFCFATTLETILQMTTCPFQSKLCQKPPRILQFLIIRTIMSTNTAVSGGNNLLELAIDINRFYSIHELICSKLNIVDIIALSRTCKRYSGLYSYLQKTKWNINTRLSDYFTDPRAFRAVQGTTGTCIIGSFARDFFECNARARSAGSKRMLDLRVKVGKDGLALKEYLVTEGYIKDERPEHNFYDVQVSSYPSRRA